MKIGKIAEPVLIRSVLKETGHRREEVLEGPAAGRDASLLENKEGTCTAVSAKSFTGLRKEAVRPALYTAVNDLAAAGADPVGILVNLLLTPDAEESSLKKIMRELEGFCKEQGLEILGGHTEVTQAVTKPVVTVTGIGKIEKDRRISSSFAKPGQDVVLTKWIGLYGTAFAAKAEEAKLLDRFAPSFVETAKSFEAYSLVTKDAELAAKYGVSAMHDLEEGGVFGGLWELCSASGTGIDVDLKKIPIRQETVEVCEALGLNPYLLMSCGSLLLTAEDGFGLVRKLEQEGIHGAVIGKITDGNDKIIRNGSDTRYLDKPQADEIYKIEA